MAIVILPGMVPVTRELIEAACRQCVDEDCTEEDIQLLIRVTERILELLDNSS